MEFSEQKLTQSQAQIRQSVFIILCVCSIWLQPAISADSDRLVSLTLEERAGVSRRKEPVTAGVPLPQGAAREAETLALLDERGQPVRAQIKPVSRWLGNDTLKWVHIHFQADVPPNARRTLTLVHSRRTAPEKSGLRVSDEKDRITVDTGPLKFIVGKSKFNGIGL